MLLICTSLVAGATGGCSMPRPLSAPKAQVRDVSVVEQTNQGARVEAVVLLTNPNKTALPLVESSYSLTVSGAGTYEWSDQVHRTLPASGRQVVVLPAVLATEGVDVRGREYEIDGSIIYKPPGQIRQLMTEAKIPLPRVHFSGKGQLE